MSTKSGPVGAQQRGSSVWSLPGRLVRRYRETAEQRPDEEINLRILTAFVATFTGVRIITHGIRGDWLPLKNIQLGKGKGSQPLHIHHLVWGILALTGCGYGSLLRTGPKWRRRLAPLYGAGVALTFDEFALWLRLEDDYWSSEGRASVDAVIILSAIFGLAVASPLFWQGVLEEILKTTPPTGISSKIGDISPQGS
ncbi:MAG: hypothetical protein M0027_10690 [Candidatus Dormibacteraeota bacterium]|nr:hypothetical protein [Candidatus Dormibacteraeota bacterium]